MTKKAAKKEVRLVKSRQLVKLDVYDFDGEIGSIIQKLEGIKKEFSQYDKIIIEEEMEDDYYDAHYQRFYVYGLRAETDEDRAKAKAESDKAAEIQKARRRKSWAELNEEFGLPS